jgi:putative ABC transport system permease protein
VIAQASAPAAAIALSPLQVGLAAGLMLVVAGVSVGLRLGVERQLLWASIRTVTQLTLVGLVLDWIFAVNTWWLVLGIGLFMAAVAGHAAIQRSSRVMPGLLLRSYGALTVSAFASTLVATTVILRTDAWHEAQYFIPLLGMVLGNSLNGISLGIDTLLDRLSTQRELVEMDLSLGATRWEAARDHVAEAVRRGLMPILNTMTVVGLVSLPGMMTGQIIAGAPPMQAVKYQIVIMFMIAAATALGCVLANLAVYRRLFTADHRLRSDLIRSR